jgi:ABC-type lipoprotein release transport system permease subunit
MAVPLSYNVRNVRQRWQVTLLAVAGISLVVTVFIVLLALTSGLRIALAATGALDNAIVVQRGANAEMTSGVPKANADVLTADGRVARDAQGRPLASPEVVIIATLPKRIDGTLTNVQVRGVTPTAFQVRANVRVVEGRAMQPGTTEVIVGRRVVERFSGITIGSAIRIKQRDWPIVGVFEADGSSFESEVWGDLDVMASVFNRQGGYQSVTLKLADPAQLATWADEVQADPRLPVDLKAERTFYEDQAGPVAGALLGLTVFVSFVMAIGAVFGAMNTMYAVVAQRTREIGTLRALGFARRSILLSFLVESVVIALVAGVIGVLLALPANNLSTATGNVTFSELAFAFRVTPRAIAGGLVFAALMGVGGGLLPAFRAARLPIIAALREA